MATIPNALIKDLLSTGYFYDELKNYSESKEIDLTTYSRNYAVPYLTKLSKSYERSGQFDRSRILNLAVEHLSDTDAEALGRSILSLRKVVASEIDTNEKVLHQNDQHDKAEIQSSRRKSESAQSLAKLLVAIIRTFKLAEVIAKRDKPGGVRDSTDNTINDALEPPALPNV